MCFSEAMHKDSASDISCLKATSFAMFACLGGAINGLYRRAYATDLVLSVGLDTSAAIISIVVATDCI